MRCLRMMISSAFVVEVFMSATLAEEVSGRQWLSSWTRVAPTLVPTATDNAARAAEAAKFTAAPPAPHSLRMVGRMAPMDIDATLARGCVRPFDGRMGWDPLLAGADVALALPAALLTVGGSVRRC